MSQLRRQYIQMREGWKRITKQSCYTYGLHTVCDTWMCSVFNHWLHACRWTYPLIQDGRSLLLVDANIMPKINKYRINSSVFIWTCLRFSVSFLEYIIPRAFWDLMQPVSSCSTALAASVHHLIASSSDWVMPKPCKCAWPTLNWALGTKCWYFLFLVSATTFIYCIPLC